MHSNYKSKNLRCFKGSFILNYSTLTKFSPPALPSGLMSSAQGLLSVVIGWKKFLEIFLWIFFRQSNFFGPTWKPLASRVISIKNWWASEKKSKPARFLLLPWSIELCLKNTLKMLVSKAPEVLYWIIQVWFGHSLFGLMSRVFRVFKLCY
jgi:hypothetical protein